MTTTSRGSIAQNGKRRGRGGERGWREKMRSVNGKRGGEWLARGENGRVTHFLQRREVETEE